MKLQRMKPTLIKPVLCSLLLILLSVYSAIAEKEPDNTGQSFTLSFDQVMNDVAEPRYEFPKYTTQLINLANQNSQATRAYNVGQMSELIQEFPAGPMMNGWTGIKKNIPMPLSRPQTKPGR
ncbi:MAG: MjaI family restriction endonuclease [Desulfobacterales bacterium]